MLKYLHKSFVYKIFLFTSLKKQDLQGQLNNHFRFLEIPPWYSFNLKFKIYATTGAKKSSVHCIDNCNLLIF